MVGFGAKPKEWQNSMYRSMCSKIWQRPWDKIGKQTKQSIFGDSSPLNQFYGLNGL